MPANKTRKTLARQWELLKLLPTRGPGKTAKELAEALNEAGFAVSKRQVERDLGELYDAFRLECNNASTPFGWRLPPKAPTDIPGLTLAEALSIRLVEDALKRLMPRAVLHALESRFQQAKRKLDAIAEDNPAVQWADKVRSVPPSLPLLPPAIDPDVLETVTEALLASRQIDVEYHAMSDGETRPMRLHALGLVSRVPATYLVATAFAYSDVRLYALHRIVRASKTDEVVKRPEGFDLDAYIRSGALQFGTGENIRLEAELSEDLAQVLRETPLAPDQRINGQDDTITLAATVADSWQLRWWILSQNAGIVVREPRQLRDEIRESLQKALAAYATVSAEQAGFR
jgi:predicted DNA-binding transcriptional regulator YafY